MISNLASHNHGSTSAYLNQTLNNLIKNEINRLVMKENVTNMKFIKYAINQLIRKNTPSSTVNHLSKAFCPSIKILRNHVLKNVYIKNKSKINQESIELNLKRWSCNAKVYFRPYKENGNVLQALLF